METRLTEPAARRRRDSSHAPGGRRSRRARARRGVFREGLRAARAAGAVWAGPREVPPASTPSTRVPRRRRRRDAARRDRVASSPSRGRAPTGTPPTGSRRAASSAPSATTRRRTSPSIAAARAAPLPGEPDARRVSPEEVTPAVGPGRARRGDRLAARSSLGWSAATLARRARGLGRWDCGLAALAAASAAMMAFHRRRARRSSRPPPRRSCDRRARAPPVAASPSPPPRRTPFGRGARGHRAGRGGGVRGRPRFAAGSRTARTPRDLGAEGADRSSSKGAFRSGSFTIRRSRSRIPSIRSSRRSRWPRSRWRRGPGIAHALALSSTRHRSSPRSLVVSGFLSRRVSRTGGRSRRAARRRCARRSGRRRSVRDGGDPARVRAWSSRRSRSWTYLERAVGLVALRLVISAALSRRRPKQEGRRVSASFSPRALVLRRGTRFRLARLRRRCWCPQGRLVALARSRPRRAPRGLRRVRCSRRLGGGEPRAAPARRVRPPRERRDRATRGSSRAGIAIVLLFGAPSFADALIAPLCSRSSPIPPSRRRPRRIRSRQLGASFGRTAAVLWPRGGDAPASRARLATIRSPSPRAAAALAVSRAGWSRARGGPWPCPLARGKPAAAPRRPVTVAGLARPTFHGTVEPILQARCQSCHHEKRHRAVRARALFRDAAARGARSRGMVDARRMPPWKAAIGPHAFADDPSLSGAERAAIVALGGRGRAGGRIRRTLRRRGRSPGAGSSASRTSS